MSSLLSDTLELKTANWTFNFGLPLDFLLVCRLVLFNTAETVTTVLTISALENPDLRMFLTVVQDSISVTVKLFVTNKTGIFLQIFSQNPCFGSLTSSKTNDFFMFLFVFFKITADVAAVVTEIAVENPLSGMFSPVMRDSRTV